VSTTQAIDLCDGLSVIGSVVDTSDKFITGVVDTTEQLSPVTMTPAINLSLVSTLLNNFARDNDTCDKFFPGINNTVEQSSPVTTTPAITFFPGVIAEMSKKTEVVHRCQ
jgi:hypothetical protein